MDSRSLLNSAVPAALVSTFPRLPALTSRATIVPPYDMQTWTQNLGTSSAIHFSIRVSVTATYAHARVEEPCTASPRSLHLITERAALRYVGRGIRSACWDKPDIATPC